MTPLFYRNVKQNYAITFMTCKIISFIVYIINNKNLTSVQANTIPRMNRYPFTLLRHFIHHNIVNFPLAVAIYELYFIFG